MRRMLCPCCAHAVPLLCLQVPSFDNKVAMDLIESELGRPWQEVYAELTPEPIAAASLGQVTAAAGSVRLCCVCMLYMYAMLCAVLSVLCVLCVCMCWRASGLPWQSSVVAGGAARCAAGRRPELLPASHALLAF